jgi:hypothetical protein
MFVKFANLLYMRKQDEESPEELKKLEKCGG